MTNTTQPQLEIERIITNLNNQVKDCTQAILKLREANMWLGYLTGVKAQRSEVSLPRPSYVNRYAEIYNNDGSLLESQDQMEKDNVVMIEGFFGELNLFGAIEYLTKDMNLYFEKVDGKISVTKTGTDNTILLVYGKYSFKNRWSFDTITDCDSQIEVKKVPTSDGEMLLIQF